MDFYLIQLKKVCLLYTEEELVQSASRGNSQDHVDRFIQKFSGGKAGKENSLSRLIRIVRDFYYRLENRIDPMERVFKRMRDAKNLRLYVSSGLSTSEALVKLKALLKHQKKRHAIWILVDAVLAICALGLSPFLMPIPGPNLFLYYPVLRVISHYLAYKGTVHGLWLVPSPLIGLDELADLEILLSQKNSPRAIQRISEVARKLRLEKFPDFISRHIE